MFGLLETKIKSVNFHIIANRIFADWSISTNNNLHPRGRVWVLWKPHLFDIQFIQYDAQFIHMNVVNKIDQMHFSLTIIYAFNGVGERVSLWSNLQNIVNQVSGLWAIGGDFNCVLHSNERLGGNVSIADSEPFYDCLQTRGLMDLAATGAFYTWNNMQPLATKIYSRLDKLFVNQDWMVTIPGFMANFLPEGHFDHTPCLVSKGLLGGGKKRPFKYYNMWGSATGFQDCVANVWNQYISGTKMYGVVWKLKLLKPELKKINIKCYTDIENSADIAMIKLTHLQEKLVLCPGDEEFI
ncbi:uncharacterized protein LOC141630894 [Silene latifolia]|uniref:uncharacterized protein LOC141630894 n=1 Tax=Silene latifolia TaxID=37657 RepID=UPI003D7882E1